MTEQFKVGDEVFLRGKISEFSEVYDQQTALLSTSMGSVLVSEKDLAPVPQKVIIPQFVAEWITELKHYYNLYVIFNKLTLNLAPNDITNWFYRNPTERSIILACAWLDGYEVEKERIYQIPLKGLMTIDGKQQYLTYKDGKYFASQKYIELKQTFTQSELDNSVPKYYRLFAEGVVDDTNI